MKCIVVWILMFLPALANAGNVMETQHLELSTQGIKMLVVNCGAGSLDLKGVKSLDKIKVSAEIVVEDFNIEKLHQFIETNVRLNLIRQKNRALLESEIKKEVLSNIEARINLAIEIPGKLDVKISDGSGPISVKGLLGNLKINDDSGEIIIEDIVGKVAIFDGSGSIQIEDIRGAVMVKDGSGLIEIDYVKGDVYISDGSGEMTIRHIDGNVTVSDGSGSIDISDVSKNVFISEAGSGELEIERIKGKFTHLE